MKRKLVLLMIAILAGIGWAIPAVSAENDEEEGFSAYSVARLKVFEGTAWVRLPDSGEWEEYSTNTPIPERSRINIPEGSEAELQFHGGQFVLLTEGTEVDVRRFDEGGTTFRLRSGEIRFDLPPDDFSPVIVNLVGGGSAGFNVPGRYWLDVIGDGETRLVVRSGEGSVSAAGGNYIVKAGEEAAIGSDVRIAAYAGDDGGRIEEDRPPMTEEEQNAGVPPAAAYELRDYGEWVNTDDYGYAWRPRVVAGWSPYYYGRWSWISPYGWTWVSYEPWGWYPYHFGWWLNDPVFGWCWSPYRSFVSVNFAFGSFRYAHFHRHSQFYPATVRFVRDGGYVRWVPLRPGERFVRPGFTRTNSRLAGWERPIPRNTVFVRQGDARKSEWKGWSDARRGRNRVVVRETDSRQGRSREIPRVRDVRPDAKQRMERIPDARQRMERTLPERQERMRDFDRRERPPQREFRGREGRGGRSRLPDVNAPKRGTPARTDVSPPRVRGEQRVSPDKARVPGPSPDVRREEKRPPSRVRDSSPDMRPVSRPRGPERVHVPQAREPGIRRDGMRPQGRMERPMRESQPRVVAPPPYGKESPRGEAFRPERPAMRAPERNMAPERRPAAQPVQGADSGRNSERGNFGGRGGGRR